MLGRVWQAVSGALNRVASSRLFKPAVFLLAAVPAALLGWDAYRGDLGVDPIKTLLHETGEDALLMLFISLAVTPVRRLFKVNKLQLVRRMLGLWAFFYAVSHLSIYLVFDQLCYSLETCDFQTIWKDILLRKFIFIGQLAFALLLALALTSTKGWQRRLGRNWTRLHRAAYVAAVAGVVHFIWIQKSDITEPLKWAAVLAVLLGVRLIWAVRARRSVAKVAVTA